jgi:hypothetical protein
MRASMSALVGAEKSWLDVHADCYRAVLLIVLARVILIVCTPSFVLYSLLH